MSDAQERALALLAQFPYENVRTEEYADGVYIVAEQHVEGRATMYMVLALCQSPTDHVDAQTREDAAFFAAAPGLLRALCEDLQCAENALKIAHLKEGLDGQ